MVAAPELRRERVRQLLGHLLVHERPTRAGVAAELWPDLDELAAGRNLRVTLAYLQDVLEPEREELDPPYFVRSTGTLLQLVADGALEVDAVAFERVLDAAARRSGGAPSEATATYQRAVDAGDRHYLVDVEGGELELERDRLRARFLAAAVRAGNLLLAAASPAGPASSPNGRCGPTSGRRAPTSSSSPPSSPRGTSSAHGGGCSGASDPRRARRPPQPRTVALGRRLDGRRLASR